MRIRRIPALGIALLTALGLCITACGFEGDLGVEAGDATESPVRPDEPATPASTVPDSTTPDTNEPTTVPDTEATSPDTEPADTEPTDTEPTTTEPTSTAPKDDVPVIVLDTDKPEQDYDSFVESALNEIQRFWRLTFERLFGKAYDDLEGGVYPVYPGRRDVPGGCGMNRTTYRDVEGNAFYCGEGDFIAYDDTQLFPTIDEEIGRFALAVALAHEWGHAIQQRAGFPDDTTTLLLEQQADCFAGAFVGFLAGGNGQYIDFEDEDLVQAINGLIAVRDEPGEVDSNPNAHGNAFDRVGAFQDGFVDGAQRCKNYATDAPRSTLLPFTQGDFETGGNAPYVGLIADLLGPALDKVWNEILGAQDVTFTAPTVDMGDDDTAARCEDVPEDALKVAFFCAATNTIVASDDRLRDLYDTYGDNAVGLLIANAYSEAVQAALDSSLLGEARALANDCLTGAWTAKLFPPDGVDIGGEAPVVMSAGDLDEAIRTLVLIGDARTDTDERGSPFEKIDSFRTGVLDGLEACLAMVGD